MAGPRKPRTTPTDTGFEPKTFTRQVDGVTKELTANSAADAVRLIFDGWREKSGAASANAPARSTTPTRAAGDSGA